MPGIHPRGTSNSFEGASTPPMGGLEGLPNPHEPPRGDQDSTRTQEFLRDLRPPGIAKEHTCASGA